MLHLDLLLRQQMQSARMPDGCLLHQKVTSCSALRSLDVLSWWYYILFNKLFLLLSSTYDAFTYPRYIGAQWLYETRRGPMCLGDRQTLPNETEMVE